VWKSSWFEHRCWESRGSDETLTFCSCLSLKDVEVCDNDREGGRAREAHVSPDQALREVHSRPVGSIFFLWEALLCRAMADVWMDIFTMCL
jgi:hypothetical protein